jgi:hypothetical protein
MDAGFREHLIQRHGLDRWEESATVLRKIELTGVEIPGWRMVRSERTGDTVDSLWTQSDDQLLRVVVVEAAARAAAREALLEWLGEFESPLLARRPMGLAGDAAFAMPGESAVVFTRGNVVVVMRNAGPKVQGLGPAAAGLDQALLRRAGGPA